MERIPRGIYTQEFREQAIRLVEVDGLAIKEAARRLSLPVGKGQKPLTDMEMELSRVKKELAEVKLERDLLKKCAAYFAKESR